MSELLFKGWWAAAVAAALAGLPAWAGRPLTVDDADPVEVGQFEAEAGVGYVRDSVCHHWDVPLGLTAGALPGVEIGFGFGQQFEKRAEVLQDKKGERHVHENGVGDLVLAAKWQFASEGDWLPRQAVVPSVKLPTADESDGLGSGETDYDLMWIASKSLSERLGAHLNLGYAWVGDPDGEKLGDVVHGGAALDYQLSDPLQLVAELFAENERDAGGGTAVQYNLGLRWQVADAWIVDAAAGSRLCGDGTPDFAATVGVTWTFGFSGE